MSVYTFSGVVEFLSNGRVSVSHLDFKEIDYEQVLNAFSHTKDKDYLTHAFNLKNAYDDSIMDFTNYTYVAGSIFLSLSAQTVL